MRPDTSHAARQAIDQTGLIALIPGAFPIDELLQIGDALLAAPVLSVALSLYHPEALAALPALRQRFGRHLSWGVTDVATQTQAQAALTGGAQFLLTERVDPPLLRLGVTQQCLVLPLITARTEVDTAVAVGVQGIQLAADQSIALVSEIRHSYPNLVIVVCNVPGADLGRWASTGATALAIGDPLIPRDHWSARTIITQARYYRRLWAQGMR